MLGRFKIMVLRAKLKKEKREILLQLMEVKRKLKKLDEMEKGIKK